MMICLMVIMSFVWFRYGCCNTWFDIYLLYGTGIVTGPIKIRTENLLVKNRSICCKFSLKYSLKILIEIFSRHFEISHMTDLFTLFVWLFFSPISPVRNSSMNWFYCYFVFDCRSRTILMFFCLFTISKFC
jgi:hypothetical protein